MSRFLCKEMQRHLITVFAGVFVCFLSASVGGETMTCVKPTTVTLTDVACTTTTQGVDYYSESIQVPTSGTLTRNVELTDIGTTTTLTPGPSPSCTPTFPTVKTWLLYE